ncbi:chemotaxis response regulator protein-glutamate methylesterase [Paenibacillus yonginensis]|uniref:Protein-glutamate methylesterase/protein-glutamine glutaminase n=1 Tax=Paenibacillus yonginensis TaxID=1462996 RepID=A0A1B1MXX1_9BACL|nr:chemotaxis response regulator protein-glutamate methylesterase [Paenibacillus yonginensis]ANS74018.1 chemotaxis response regulator protein-glutamate methylesterase [Paenibacillus yonginensis]
MKPYRILVVDDSPFMRKIITDLIEQDPAFWVERTAANGLEAVKLIKELSPDLVTMDVEMPEMNGLEALKSIMHEHPVPVIMLSGINEQGMRETIMALELGAFDFIRKPSITGNSQSIAEIGEALRMQIQAAMASRERRLAREEALRKRAEEPKVPPQPHIESAAKTTKSAKSEQLPGLSAESVGKVKNSAATSKGRSQAPEPNSMAESKVDRRAVAKPKGTAPAPGKEAPVKPAQFPKVLPKERSKPSVPDLEPLTAPAAAPDKGANMPRRAVSSGGYQHIVAVGCSTGGPKALKVLLESIPAEFPAPIVIVQHMPPNFTKSLAQRLNSLSPITVVEAEEGMVLEKGTAYIAPGGKHTRVKLGDDGVCRIALGNDELRSGHRPSVDVLFESLLPLGVLQRHVVLMTGMGSDGAKSMKLLYDKGVTSTIAESEETCVVYGMPRSAVELGCVTSVLPLQDIAQKLVQIVK